MSLRAFVGAWCISFDPRYGARVGVHQSVRRFSVNPGAIEYFTQDYKDYCDEPTPEIPKNVSPPPSLGRAASSFVRAQSDAIPEDVGGE